MEKDEITKIKEVGILPNLFLRVVFDDTIKYWRSNLSEMEMNLFKTKNQNNLALHN